jgi:ubiquinone/menaquinone biosynthesis C-methylase UbiE
MCSGFYNAEMAAKQEQMAKTRDLVRQRAEIMRLLSPDRGETILELGSGNGILVRDMLEAVGPKGRIVGLDTSDAILETAQHICPRRSFSLGTRRICRSTTQLSTLSWRHSCSVF